MPDKTNKQIFIGVDVGGTKIGINGLDHARNPISEQWVEVPALSHLGPQSTVKQIVLGVQNFVEKQNISPDRIAGVGVDSPGPADINGVIAKTANLHGDWEGFPLREQAQHALSAAFGQAVPVHYENDCNAGALWESYRGCPEGTEIMAFLAPGTGLGGGIVIHGHLLRGVHGMAAELGHVFIVHSSFVPGVEPLCGCGRKYCAEAYVSMAALMKILPAALELPKWKDHPLHAITGDEMWRKRAFQVRGMAARGDELCLSIFEWQARALGKLCFQVANVIDPARIVIGGGFIEGGLVLTDRVMGIIRHTFKELAFKKHAEELVIETASAGDQAGCLGAALSAWQFAQVW